MSTGIKDKARQMIDVLPDDMTWEQLLDVIYETLAIEAGLKDVAAGRVVSVEEVRREFGLA